jgi:WD40 repeat protein
MYPWILLLLPRRTGGQPFLECSANNRGTVIYPNTVKSIIMFSLFAPNCVSTCLFVYSFPADATQEYKLSATLPGSQAPVNCLAFSKNGRFLASGSLLCYSVSGLLMRDGSCAIFLTWVSQCTKLLLCSLQVQLKLTESSNVDLSALQRQSQRLAGSSLLLR